MNADHNQGWSFFWAAPELDYENALAEEREFRRKMLYRCALLATILSEGSEENRPQAS